jgi:hypothetical protein
VKRRRSVILVLGIALLALVAILGIAAIFVKQEPSFYRAALKEDFSDAAKAADFFTRVTELQQDIRSSKPDWGASFTADDINAFLRVSLAKGGSLEGSLNERYTDPRIAIQGDRIKIAMRYQAAPFDEVKGESTLVVLSLELKVWVVSKRQNTVAVEVIRANAGGIPVSVQRYLDRLSEAARDANIEVTWFRHDGNPVGLFQLYADQVQPTTQIRTAKVEDGKITVAGKSILEFNVP